MFLASKLRDVRIILTPSSLGRAMTVTSIAQQHALNVLIERSEESGNVLCYHVSCKLERVWILTVVAYFV